MSKKQLLIVFSGYDPINGSTATIANWIAEGAKNT
jgi:hypothetical protein